MKRLIPIFNAFFNMSNMDINTWLRKNNCNLRYRINHYDYDLCNKMIGTVIVNNAEKTTHISDLVFGAEWEVDTNASLYQSDVNSYLITSVFRLVKGTVPKSAVAVEFEMSQWSSDNYVLLPGAAYNGNRFESRRLAYSPKLLDPRDWGIDKAPIITDVPRLNIKEGPSFIQERSGSMTTPAIGFQSSNSCKGAFVLCEQNNVLGDYGMNITESRDRKTAWINIQSPVVRELYKYRITDNQWPSDDIPKDFNVGDIVTIRTFISFFDAPKIQSLFDKLLSLRNALIPKESIPVSIPFSSTLAIQEDKFNRQNWVAEQGYYSVGMREMFLQDWQIGWTGGMISTYPLLFAGSEETRQRVIKNFNWLFPDGIAPSGFFWDSGEFKDGKMNWYGGDIRKPTTKNWHLIRKSSDAVYYIIKQFMLMESMGINVEKHWREGITNVCNAFVKLWAKYHQFGNFVDSLSGEIAVGGSTSAGIAPAGLALAAKYLKNDIYLNVAEESALYFYNNFVQKGLSMGGPGDAMQNPDSESAYGMLESFTVLFELTGKDNYLKMSTEMASQMASWVMSYNYQFQNECLLKTLNIKTKGSVTANTQNKHGSPGICTASGIALLRLYRATGNVFYLELLRDIARHIPQVMSHPKRPIDKMPIGWITERVSTTDWFEGLGEIMYGSTWAETALMLTSIEIPSIYILRDTNFVFEFDFIEAKILSNDGDNLSVQLTNPSICECQLRILVESSAELKNPLGENRLFACELINLHAGESRIINLKN